MSVFEHFLHTFTPRHTNNHRPKILHPSGLTVLVGLLLVFQILITAVTRFQPGILGYASNISVGDLLSQTNSRRSSAGVGALALNSQLSNAAAGKASDMFTNQYWAHTSPSGKSPWNFIIAAGYSYLFAGENLARDFGDSGAVVDAWMNSPTHRENLVNPRYKDVGFAVVNGKYGSHETTVVVQMFGTKPGTAPSVEAPTLQIPTPIPTPTPLASPAGEILNLQVPPTSPTTETPKFNPFTVTRNVSLALVGVLMAVLIIDGVLVYRRRIARLSGHNLAHLLMLLAALAALNLIGRGVIL